MVHEKKQIGPIQEFYAICVGWFRTQSCSDQRWLDHQRGCHRTTTKPAIKGTFSLTLFVVSINGSARFLSPLTHLTVIMRMLQAFSMYLIYKVDRHQSRLTTIIYRINRCFGFGFTLLDPSMNDVINGVTPLTIRRNYADVRNVRIKNAQKHAVTFTNKLFYNFIFLFWC